MIAAFLRGLSSLSLPPLRRIVATSLGLSVVAFALLWIGVAAALYEVEFFSWAPLNWLIDLLGGVAVLALSWLLFPAVATLMTSFYLDRVAGTVEAADYPARGPARRQPAGEIVATTVRLMSVTLAVNLVALPIYLLVPGINLFLFLAINGYLLGREYFEVVALRRLGPPEAMALRRRFAGRIFVGGILIAGLFAIPLVNLVAPVVATAFMVHMFEVMPRARLEDGQMA